MSFVIFIELLLQKGYYSCPYGELVWMHALTRNEKWNLNRSQNRKDLGDHLAQPIIFREEMKTKKREWWSWGHTAREAGPRHFPTTVPCAKLFPQAFGFVGLLYVAPLVKWQNYQVHSMMVETLTSVFKISISKWFLSLLATFIIENAVHSKSWLSMVVMFKCLHGH